MDMFQQGDLKAVLSENKQVESHGISCYRLCQNLPRRGLPHTHKPRLCLSCKDKPPFPAPVPGRGADPGRQARSKGMLLGAVFTLEGRCS